jgi:Cu(I)/Ag(I) efflux system membrane protein CusA/SilA
MIERIIASCITHRVLVILLTLLLAIAGGLAMWRTPVDAIPDLTDVQVILFTEFAGQAPQVVEDQVTYPLTTAMMAVPQASVVRGYSFFGSSFVYVIFEDGTDLYWARSRVLEYLNYASKRLPAGITPTLGPDATGLGWIYEYVLDGGDRYDLQQLRSIQDWFLRYELTSVPGVAEVASIGGYVKQYQVEVDPNRLLAYDIPISTVVSALQRSNNDVGGRLVEIGETEFMVRGLGYITSIQDVENVPVGVDGDGTPILIRNVAQVHLGPEMRRGLLEWNGEGEVVGGIVVMRYGENALATIRAVKEKLEELKAGLPEGVTIQAAYDRSGLIERAIDNIQATLIEECLIVALVTIAFLLHVRSALVAIFTLPMGILIAFLVMDVQGLNANIMSLSGIAIAIGAMVDAAMVMVENAHKHLERDAGKKEHWQIILDAAKEVGPALFFSLLVLTLSFVPVFSLEAQEGRLFKPLAFTKTYALAASALLAITVIPVLMGYFVRGKILPETRNPLNRALIALFRPAIHAVLRFRWTTIAIAIAVLALTLYPLSRLGSEFMPPLNEGDLLYMPTTDPGLSAVKAREVLQQTDKIIRQFPEVHHVLGKAGRAETATDSAPLSMMETIITLRPETEWREGMTIERLIAELDGAIAYPGLANAWTMPIRTRVDMLSTGIRTPIGIKVMGPDLNVLAQLSERVAAVVGSVPGVLSAFPERAVGDNYLDYRIKREEAARYGLTVGDVQDIIISAIGGVNVTQTVEGLERYPVNVRYSRELRDNLPALQRVLIPTPSGTHIPLSYVADYAFEKGPMSIKSENARRTSWVFVDTRESDIGSVVARARQAVEREVALPEGYNLVWSGQYEYIERARERLQVVIPFTLFLIFVLLYMSFKRIGETLIVMLSLPFAMVGGVWLVYLLDYNLSVAVGVGFIALAGVAAETGVIMLVYLDQAYRDRLSRGAMKAVSDLYAAVVYGAVERVRPKMMTVFADMAGLLPIMWGFGTGSEVMKRIAAPMVGGMISSTVLTLLVIPAIYYIWKQRSLRDN